MAISPLQKLINFQSLKSGSDGMSAAGKIIALLIVLAVIYVAVAKPAMPFSVPGLDNSAKIREIDSRFGVGPEKFSPVALREIEEYESALFRICKCYRKRYCKIV